MTPEQWRDEIIGALRQHFLPDVGRWRQYLESVIPEMIRTVQAEARQRHAGSYDPGEGFDGVSEAAEAMRAWADMTPEEKAESLNAHLLLTSGHPNVVRQLTAATIRAAEAEAYQRGVAEEREACAKQVESFRMGGPSPETVIFVGEALANAIRARGTT